MQCRTITQKDTQLPARLVPLLGNAFPAITVAGNLDILSQKESSIVGLFCSRDCPGSLILPAFDQVTALRDQGRIVVSGFHSEMELECLKILLRGVQPIIICPARAIHNMRVPDFLRKPLEENRLLIISPFAMSQKRPSTKWADHRNKLVACLADENFIIHAKMDSGLLSVAVQSMNAGKRTVTIKDTVNQAIIEAGVVTL